MGSADYPINNTNSPISIANFNAVGGSTILFSGHYPRLHPSDLSTHTLDGVAEDWPITYEKLEKYYNRNQENVAVAGLEGDPAYFPRFHLEKWWMYWLKVSIEKGGTGGQLILR